MMSDNDSVSSSSSDEEIVMEKAVEVDKAKRKGRGKAKAKTPDEKVEEVVAAAVAPPKAKRAKKVKVDEPVVEEIPPHQGGDPIKKTRKSRSKSVDVEPYTQVTKRVWKILKRSLLARRRNPPLNLNQLPMNSL
jgi:hypothetical protein